MFSFRNDPGTDGAGIAFTDREGGSSAPPLGPLNLGRTDVDDPAALRANLAAVRAELGVRAVVTAHQVHGTAVLDADDELLATWNDDSWLGNSVPDGRPLRRADALVTTRRAIGLAVRVADCVPVLLADPGAGVIGAAHAGRPGLAAGVLEAVVGRMRELGAGRISAWIGPHVCGDCYEVPAELQAAVTARVPATRAVTSWGTPSLDLGAGAQSVLAGLGCAVTRVDPCTRTTPTLHSYRRDGDRSGRQAGIVWLP